MSAIRMSDDQYRQLQQRMNLALNRSLVGNPKATVKKDRRGKNKYGATKTTVDGIKFDSEGESKRYMYLKLLEKAGEISELEWQVRYDLIPAQDVDGHKEKPVYYLADFRYRNKAGALVVEDVKSAPTKTREYVIKRKLLLLIHGIRITEVMMD